ncbi:hypothetical protein BDV59DRAFT_183778 [Aspergillus ambiguus]|uniref:uncharacterized protein n=1 Tax=Aspergillus ambiguus TaxID=176160 RepID=UPI003CCE0E0D
MSSAFYNLHSRTRFTLLPIPSVALHPRRSIAPPSCRRSVLVILSNDPQARIRGPREWSVASIGLGYAATIMCECFLTVE